MTALSQIATCFSNVGGFDWDSEKKEFGLTYHMALHSLGLTCEELHESDIQLSLRKINRSSYGSLSMCRVVERPPTDMGSSSHVPQTRQNLVSIELVIEDLNTCLERCHMWQGHVQSFQIIPFRPSHRHLFGGLPPVDAVLMPPAAA